MAAPLRLAVRHETIYRYDAPATYSIQYIRLTPRSNAAQRVVRWRLSAPGKLHETIDAFGNLTHVAVLDRAHSELRVGVSGEVESHDTEGLWPGGEEPQPPEIFLRATGLTRPDAALAEFADRFRPRVARDRGAGLEALLGAVRDHIVYAQGATDVATTAGEAWRARSGVCQDHAHVFLGCARRLGVPARYVSGYLFAEGAQEMASHAWAEVWLDDRGWTGFDITNGRRADQHHIRIAVGLDYLDASPVRGMRRGGGRESMHVRVFVTTGQSPAEQQQ
jgi:transglutaminase-like putative cysteine protease